MFLRYNVDVAGVGAAGGPAGAARGDRARAAAGRRLLARLLRRLQRVGAGAAALPHRLLVSITPSCIFGDIQFMI